MRRGLLLFPLTVGVAAAIPTGASATPGSRLPVPVSTDLGVVVSESPAASRLGRQALERGGNAVDAAAAMVFGLGVARPQSCGIGGGGFMVYRSRTGATRTLDFRETAPAAFTPTTLDPPGLHKTFTGHLTVGVPGVVAGLDAMLARYGKGSLADAAAPAEELARKGFKVPNVLSGALKANLARISLFPESGRILTKDGVPYEAGDRFANPDLAATYRRIIRGGKDAFYTGTIAKQVVADMTAPRATDDPGLLTLQDLAGYKAIWRAPVTTPDGSVVSMGPPTSGGVVNVEILNLLQGQQLGPTLTSTAEGIHAVAEAQRIAWADRNAYLADPAFVPQPTAQLTSQAYADSRRGEIDPAATKAHAPGTLGSLPAARAAGEETNPEGNTTQIGVIDAKGNAVSLTCTIEQEVGSAVIAPGTGFLLNNELTDFSAAGTANEPAAGKRPRSSMSPTIVVQDDRPALVTGGAGGSRIIMGALSTILNQRLGLPLEQVVDEARFDDQGTSTLTIEDARVDPAVLAGLQQRGWTLDRKGEYDVRPRVQLAGQQADGTNVAVSDSRSDRAALGQRLVVVCNGRRILVRPGDPQPSCARKPPRPVPADR